MRKIAGPLAGTLIIMTLLGAGPAGEGTEISGGGGYRVSRRTPACLGVQKTEQHATAGATARHRFEGTAITLAGEAAYGHTRTLAVACVEDCREYKPTASKGETAESGALAARVGYQWKYLGFEAGAMGSMSSRNEYPLLLPSTDLWIGPHWLYVFQSVLADMTYHNQSFLKIGAGHSSERFRARLGAGIITVPPPLDFAALNVSPTMIGDLDVRITPNLWAGLSFDYAGVFDNGVAGRLTWQFDPTGASP